MLKCRRLNMLRMYFIEHTQNVHLHFFDTYKTAASLLGRPSHGIPAESQCPWGGESQIPEPSTLRQKWSQCSPFCVSCCITGRRKWSCGASDDLVSPSDDKYRDGSVCGKTQVRDKTMETPFLLSTLQLKPSTPVSERTET